MSGRGRGWAWRLSERVYGALLLRAYPKGLRDAYGPQMRRAFRDQLREGRRQGGGARRLGGLWARTLRDLALSALARQKEGMSGTYREEVLVNERKLAAVGSVLLLAPSYFVVASALKYGLGVGLLFDPLEPLFSDPWRMGVFNAVSPVVFLGGLVAALALNAYPLLRLDVGREDGAMVGTVRLEAKPFNVSVVVVSLLLLATLVGYAFLENFALL